MAAYGGIDAVNFNAFYCVNAVVGSLSSGHFPIG
jgi:hypothetical protein